MVSLALHAAENKKHIKYWRVKERKDFSRQIGDETMSVSFYAQCETEDVYISVQRVPRG